MDTPAVTLEVKGYMAYDYINQFIATVAQDFVVTMTSTDTHGTSGCGLLRSDGNKNALNQHMVILTRRASGHLLSRSCPRPVCQGVISMPTGGIRPGQ
jgi:hypothetical protein